VVVKTFQTIAIGKASGGFCKLNRNTTDFHVGNVLFLLDLT